MSRRHVWLQLLIGWLPVWVLFATIIVTVHAVNILTAAMISFRMIVAAAALAFVVQRITERFPWRTPVSIGFVALHFLAAIVYSLSWFILNGIIESIIQRQLVIVVGIGLASFLLVGIWLYVMIAGVAYTIQSTERAARAEATATRAQLSALRSQLNPHFLFNALHTVVQLIPKEPVKAAGAAERVASLLRTTIEEDRDIVTVGEELAFVERYLDVERIRFGDRLRVRIDVPESMRTATIPSFAIQTLIENAVRHGAAPRVDPTDVTIGGTARRNAITLTVTDNGDGATAEQLGNGTGTGLRRLKERLGALYGDRAKLETTSPDSGGLRFALTIPQESID
jgi:sensor histidine kinase YesM